MYKSKLQLFLYLLLRDHITAGAVEEIMQHLPPPHITEWNFSNGYIAEYAASLTERLQDV